MTLPDNDTHATGLKPFVEHLDDLRRTVFWCAAVLCLGMLVALYLSPQILHLLKLPYTRIQITPKPILQTIGVAGGMTIAMQIGFWGGLILSLPAMLFFVCDFVFPGLKKKEQACVRRALVFAGVLFVLGVAAGYFLTLPVFLELMLRTNQWLGESTEFWITADYVDLTVKRLLIFGLVFQLPTILLALGQLGIITSRQLRDKRRHAIVILLIIAMFLTPPDPYSMVLMSIPLILLFELCIWLIWLKEHKREQSACRHQPDAGESKQPGREEP